MGWIKRNLLFVVGAAVAVVLLGAGGFYIFQDSSRNSEASTKLNEVYDTLKRLQQQKPAPGNDKIDNTAIAKEQQKQMQAWIESSKNYFQPVQPIPSGKVTSETFASALRRTVDQLQRAADDSGVTLPPKYDFSFSAQRPLVQFAAGSLPSLATQLGEVKALAEVIFSTRINALDSIQRIRVSADDLQGPPGDYTDDQAVTNDLAVITPYVITFRSFTPELARVISAFASSTNAFLIKSINVQPASAATTDTPTYGGYGGPENEGLGYPGRYGGEGRVPVPGTPAVQPTISRGGLQTVLKEQLLRITMEVELVKLLPKASKT